MKRVQIQLPEPLAKQLYAIADLRDLSFAEICRRGLERYAEQCETKPITKKSTWTFPTLPAAEMNEAAVLERSELDVFEHRVRG